MIGNVSKVAIVTGGGSGIGRATSYALADAGMAIGVIDLDAASAETTASAITERGGNARAIGADIADWAAVGNAVGELIDVLGPVDVLVNNAALVGFTADPPLWGPIADLSMESFARMMSINYLGTVAVTKAVLPGMIARKTGSIVNITSRFAWPEWTLASCAPYDASKRAVWAFSRVLQLEAHEHGIRVITVHPGSVASAVMDAESRGPAVDEGRAMDPDDVAQAIRHAVTAPARVEFSELLITPMHEYTSQQARDRKSVV